MDSGVGDACEIFRSEVDIIIREDHYQETDESECSKAGRGKICAGRKPVTFQSSPKTESRFIKEDMSYE